MEDVIRQTAAYIAEHPLKNLIPVVNPALTGKTGMEAAICYKLGKEYQEIDCAPVVKAAYRLRFGADIPDKADTVFNAFIPFMDFCRAKMKCRKIAAITGVQNDDLKLIQVHLEKIFAGYDDLREAFDTYFDRMYCFANMMPAPNGLNGWKNRNGKGTYGLNKDYPSEYYDNLRKPASEIPDAGQMKAWLDSVMEPYCIREMYQLSPPYPIDENYYKSGSDPDAKLPQLRNFITTAVRLIEKRGAALKRI